MRIPGLQVCPTLLRGRYRNALRTVLEEIRICTEEQDVTGLLRASTLFCLLPRMLLKRPCAKGKVGKNELLDRFDKLARNESAMLLASNEPCQDIDDPRERYVQENWGRKPNY